MQFMGLFKILKTRLKSDKNDLIQNLVQFLNKKYQMDEISGT